MIAPRPPQPTFDETADAQEQLVRLGIVTVASVYFEVGPYRYTNIADAKAQAVRDHTETAT